MTKAPKIQVRNLQYAGFNGTYAGELHVDGELAAHLRDDGHGGGIFIEWHASGGYKDSPVRARLDEYCEGLPNVVCDWMDEEDEGLKQTLDLMVGQAIYLHLKAGKRGKIVKVEAA
jgi:hypothetical protein